MEPSGINKQRFRRVFVIFLVAAVSVMFLAVTWPFLKALLVGAMLAGLCRPSYPWLTRLFGGRRSLAAALTLFIVFLLIAGPISGFIGLVVNQALGVTDQAIPWLQQHFGAASTFNAHDWLVQRFPKLATYVPEQAKIVETVGNVAKTAGALLVGGASRFTAGTATFVLNVF